MARGYAYEDIDDGFGSIGNNVRLSPRDSDARRVRQEQSRNNHQQQKLEREAQAQREATAAAEAERRAREAESAAAQREAADRAAKRQQYAGNKSQVDIENERLQRRWQKSEDRKYQEWLKNNASGSSQAELGVDPEAVRRGTSKDTGWHDQHDESIFQRGLDVNNRRYLAKEKAINEDFANAKWFNTRTGNLDLKKFNGVSNEDVASMMDELGFSAEQKRLFHNMRNQHDNYLTDAINKQRPLEEIERAAKAGQARYGALKGEITLANKKLDKVNSKVFDKYRNIVDPSTGNFYDHVPQDVRDNYDRWLNTSGETTVKLESLNKERSAIEEKIKKVQSPDHIASVNAARNKTKQEAEEFMSRRNAFIDSVGNGEQIGKLMEAVEKHKANAKNMGPIKSSLDEVGATNRIHNPGTTAVQEIEKTSGIKGLSEELAHSGGKIGKFAVGALMMYGMVQALNSNRGQQDNSQLYNPGGGM